MKDKIIELITSKGPSLPSDLTKQLGLNTMFVGAYLSELVESKKLFVTKLKVGSSPVYYLDGQQEKLQNFYKNLNGKDKEAFDLLKKEGVVRDRGQIPIVRVALRNIPDFSIQINIKTSAGDKEIFWKWYMLTDKEAEELIKKQLGAEEPKKETKENKSIKEEKKEEVKKEEIKENTAPEEPKKDDKDKIIEELKKQLEQEKETTKKEKQKIEEEKQKAETEKKDKPKDKQRTLKKEEKKEEKPTEDQLLIKIKEYCKQKNMEILESEIIKKKTEIDLILKIPSAIGSSKYYCKAKDKKKISEGDLSSAIIKGQTKKLPALFLSTGELTTKAKKELDNELKNQIIFQKL